VNPRSGDRNLLIVQAHQVHRDPALHRVEERAIQLEWARCHLAGLTSGLELTTKSSISSGSQGRSVPSRTSA
jgi:hypothetical protein